RLVPMTQFILSVICISLTELHHTGGFLGTVVMKVIATDDDQVNTLHTKIFYSIVEQANTAGFFRINSQTGDVTVQRNTLDREKQDTYKLTIKAADLDGRAGGNTGTGEILIKILDINDNIPTLEKESYEGSVEENTINVEVLKIKAIDMDLIHTDNWLAVFKIISGNEAGYFSITTDSKTNEGIIMIRKTVTDVRYAKIRDDDNWLIIDEKTADIKLNKLPDRESKFLVNGTYYINLLLDLLSDHPSKTATGTIAIQVEDYNDHCPTLTTRTQTMCYEDNFVYVTAIDQDEFPNAAPFDFTVIQESNQGNWKVEPLNGECTRTTWHIACKVVLYDPTCSRFKSNHAAQQSQQKDSMLIYDYEGQESLAGSVGCCSLLENDNDLSFLNDLGPKFKTLAEICQGSTIVTKSLSAGVSISPPRSLSPVRPSTSTHTHVHTHRETIRDRDRVDINTLNTSKVAAGSFSTVQEKQFTDRTQGLATTSKIHVQDNIMIPSQTMLVQQPTMFYAATPMYVVEPNPQVVLVAGGTQQAVGQVGVSQGLVQVSGLQGSQGVVLVDRQVGGLTGKVSQGLIQGTGSGSRQVWVENGSSGGGQAISQGFVRIQQGSAEQGLESRIHSKQVKTQSISHASTGLNKGFAQKATPKVHGSQKVVVQHKKVSLTERNVESSSA
uniref:Cadherin domain-containing protein n=1 Tax=Mola mola TaxID=94237 RepID=A0A3Q3XL52_MOLML